MEDDLLFAVKSSITNCTRTHCSADACLGNLTRSWQKRACSTAKYNVRYHPSSRMIVGINRSLYSKIITIRTILLQRVLATNHHAATEIEASAGK